MNDKIITNSDEAVSDVRQKSNMDVQHGRINLCKIKNVTER